MKITGAILAGGYSKRFGENKALIEISSKKLIERIIEVFTSIFNEILIISNSPDEYKALGFPVIQDVLPVKGPLVGIYSALLASRYKHIFISACDMPFINSNLISYMIEKIANFDIVVPVIDDEKLEPLHAIYSKSCIPHIKNKINLNEKRIISFYENLLVYHLKKDEIIKHDPPQLSFYNINTNEDYRKAQELFYQLNKMQS